VPVVLLVLANILLYVVVVFPLGRQVASAEDQARAEQLQVRRSRTDLSNAKASVTGKQEADAALQKFYKDVLPGDGSEARRITFTRLQQLAQQVERPPWQRCQLRQPREEQHPVEADDHLHAGWRLPRRAQVHLRARDHARVRDSGEHQPEYLGEYPAGDTQDRGLAMSLNIATYTAQDSWPVSDAPPPPAPRSTRPRPVFLALAVVALALVVAYIAWPAASPQAGSSNQPRVQQRQPQAGLPGRVRRGELKVRLGELEEPPPTPSEAIAIRSASSRSRRRPRHPRRGCCSPATRTTWRRRRRRGSQARHPDYVPPPPPAARPPITLKSSSCTMEQGGKKVQSSRRKGLAVLCRGRRHRARDQYRGRPRLAWSPSPWNILTSREAADSDARRVDSRQRHMTRKLAASVLLAFPRHGMRRFACVPHGQDAVRASDWGIGPSPTSPRAVQENPDSPEYKINLRRAQEEAGAAAPSRRRGQLEAQDQLDSALMEYRKSLELIGTDRLAAAKVAELGTDHPRAHRGDARQAAHRRAAAIRPQRGANAPPLLNPGSREPIRLNFNNAR
jgi:hypothetical protein